MTEIKPTWDFPEVSPTDLFFDGEFLSKSGGIARDAKSLLNLLGSNHNIFITKPLKVGFLSVRLSKYILAVFFLFTNKSKKVNAPAGAIFFQPQVSIVGVSKASGPLWVVRLHDLFPLTDPEWFGYWRSRFFTKSLKLACKSGAFFLANSSTTAHQLIEYFPETASRVKILPCSVNPIDNKLCGVCKQCSLDLKETSSYFLCVGTVEPRKNYQWLSLAWANDLNIQELGLKLVIVGKPGWKARATIRTISKKEKYGILWIDDACDGILNYLYKNATAFISASHNEGFDIPAMEARNLYNLPLILSDIDVHREFHQGEAYLFSSKKSFSEGVLRYRSKPQPFGYSQCTKIL